MNVNSENINNYVKVNKSLGYSTKSLYKVKQMWEVNNLFLRLFLFVDVFDFSLWRIRIKWLFQRKKFAKNLASIAEIRIQIRCAIWNYRLHNDPNFLHLLEKRSAKKERYEDAAEYRDKALKIKSL